MQIVTESSAWWIIVCVLAGAAYAFLLYRQPAGFSPRLRRILALLRGTVVSLIAVLLLSPLIRTIDREREKPLLILAADDSESILQSDSTAARQKLPDLLEKIRKATADKFDVHLLSFSDKVDEGKPLTFGGQQTDYSSLMRELNDRYANRNVGAVVIATDGLYNKGGNPVYEPLDFNAPLHTVALGDTVVRKDLLISDVSCNKTVYLGNTFPLEIAIEARQCNGSPFEVSVRQDSAVLFRRALSAAGNRYRIKVPVALDAKKKGLMRLQVVLSSLPGEVTVVNNSRDLLVDVRESKEKILLLANAPHPDLGAVKLQLEQSQNYEVILKMADELPASAGDYNLIIFHDLPSQRISLDGFYGKMRSAGVPALFILGSQTDLQAFNRLDIGLNVITNTPGKSNAVQAAVNPAFSVFTLSDEFSEHSSVFPPLSSPFGEYRTTGAPSVLYYQQIGTVRTQEPLVFFADAGAARTGFICGEGYWRWPLAEFARFGAVSSARELLVKSVQYLSVKDRRDKFRVIVKNSFNENEPVVMDAELYNDNFELINTPEASVEITDRQGKSFPFVFSRSDRSYSLYAGFLSPGDYRYVASAKSADRQLSVVGSFSVAEVRAEQTETVADHGLLGTLASEHGGMLFHIDEGDKLLGTLLEEEGSKVVSFSRIHLRDLIDLKSIFALLLLLLGSEWLLRKRAGSY